MLCGGEGKRWTCGKTGVVNLQKVASLVRDLSEPCLSQPGIQLLLSVSIIISLHSFGSLKELRECFRIHCMHYVVVLLPPKIR